jgi:NAD(P)H-nitrite reductase large subunit
MSLMTRVLSAAGALLTLTTLTTTALADGRDYNDGPVTNVISIRTVDGHFDDYMHWLATGFKKQQEAAKKAGIITAYRVIVVEARGPNDPDILLVTELKNWAALDGLGGKLDALSAQIQGSVEKAAQSQVERAQIRTVLGSRTAQEALLK